jgi:hypothetical protein
MSRCNWPREYLALALRNLNDGYHSFMRGDTRSRTLRFLQLSAVQDVELTLQKMSQASRYRGAGTPSPPIGNPVTSGCFGRGRLAGSGTGSRDPQGATLEPAPACQPDAGASHLHLENRERQGDSHAWLVAAVSERARGGYAPARSRFAEPARRRGVCDHVRPIPGGDCGNVATS